MPANYLIYARKSTDEEGKQVRSIEDQITELKDFAIKENLNVVDILIEKKSAKRPGRPVFNQMLEQIKQGQASGVIAWHPDRLARNSVDGGLIIYLLDQEILQFLKFPTFWFENTSQGKFMLNMSFGQAKYYVDNLAINVKRGMINKAKRGDWPGKAPPGYLNNRLTRKIDLNPKTSKYIKKAFQRYSTGNYSYQDIANWLFTKGIHGKKRQTEEPSILAVNTIYNLLTNSLYYGTFKYYGEAYQGNHKSLISKSLFDQVQGMILSKSKNSKRIHDFAFTNLIRCKECGYMITAEKRTKYYKRTNRIANYTYYHCSKKSQIKCSQPYLNQDNLTPQVNRYLKGISIPKSWKTKMLDRLSQDEDEARQNLEKHTQKLNSKLITIQSKMDKLLDNFLDGIIFRSDYLKVKDQLFNQKQSIQAKIDQFKQNQIYWLEPLKNHIQLASTGKKTATCGSLKEKRKLLAIIGSNFALNDGKLTFTWQKPWAALGAAAPIRNLVARLGFEPRIKASKASVMPFHYLALTSIHSKFEQIHLNKVF
jgi:site-specific DNA recombinase